MDRDVLKEAIKVEICRQMAVQGLNRSRETRTAEQNWVALVRQTWGIITDAEEEMARAASKLVRAGSRSKGYGRRLAQQGAANAADFTSAGEVYDRIGQRLIQLDKELERADRSFKLAMSKADISG